MSATKPYNQLQPGDTVTAIRSERDPNANVDFDRPWTVTSVTEWGGFTVSMILTEGRFWTTQGRHDDRVAVLS